VVEKSGVLENKSGHISETRQDIEKVTMEVLQELSSALSNGSIPDPYSLFFPKIGVRHPHQNSNRYYLTNG